MSKISCVAARKHDMSCGFANVWGGVLNSYNKRMINTIGNDIINSVNFYHRKLCVMLSWKGKI